MNRKNVCHKFLITCFVIILTYNNSIFAQGPNAPEAASFEPVDATDMVNLSTGSFTYVLPILNVPSPEGGYPLALAYHAGIAMDQEASWTGLGWNLNAGAINRSVNGYPDDYNSSLLTEYFYDEGDEESIYSLSLGYSNGATSVGLGFSWGSNQSLGGYVSVGYGFEAGGGTAGGSVRIGTDGIGYKVGVTTEGGLSLGVGASSSNGLSGSVGFDNNGTGFSISSSGSVNVSIAITNSHENTTSIGLTLSSNGIGLQAGVTNKTDSKVVGGAGAGLQIQFENTVKMGDYATKTSGWQIPLVVPTPVGIFSLSFGKQKFEYHLAKKELTFVTGPVYYNQEVSTIQRIWNISCGGEGSFCDSTTYTGTYEQAVAYAASISSYQGALCVCHVLTVVEPMMDIYEISIGNNNIINEGTDLTINNLTFPSYDKYNVQAQGLSGAMSSRLFENGNLFGLDSRENDQGYSLSYALNDYSSAVLPDHAKFDSKPYFYLDNEMSTYLGVSEANFNNLTTNSNILDYYANDNSVELNAKPRRRNATFVEYFTNKEIEDNYSTVKSKGYLTPGSGFNINASNIPEDGIGAFMITSADGKTYHYSLPVYNHEIVTRTFGTVAASPYENQSYFEKRQLDPYATHWLITAVTGPDYFDTNNNGIADKGDYGYWTAFEYGKLSDAFVWKAPYGQDYIEGETNSDIKTWIKGRKQIYYLDRVKTRTHTALFIKSSRNDALSTQWDYQSVAHIDYRVQDHNAYQSRFNIPSQEPLRLDKVILVKEEDDTLNKAYGASTQNYVNVNYNDSAKPSEQAWYDLKDNVLDLSDNISNIIPKAIKVIDFQYDNSLAEGRPNTNGTFYGSLTLKSVHFKGKGGEELMPPYSFNYLNNTSYIYNNDDKDGFGYKTNDNSLWSLNEITTPQGGKIQINYENNHFNIISDHEITFGSSSEFTISNSSNSSLIGDFWLSTSNTDVGLRVGDVLYDLYSYVRVNHSVITYSGTATITDTDGMNNFGVTYDNPFTYSSSPYPDAVFIPLTAKYKIQHPLNYGGIRVANLVTTDGNNSYRTEYNYGENENGIGYISYLPFAPELEKELPYGNELPSPRVMYEYVSMESFGTNNQSEGKIKYKFKVLKEKDANAIKFGDLYEIDVTSQQLTNTVANKDVVISSYTVKDNLATLGQLLEVSTINNEGQILNKIENTYYSPDDPTPNSVGVTKEAYQTYKIVDYINNTSTKDKWLVNSSARIKYPSLLKYSTEYKSGYEFSSQFGELDPVTGQANEILSIASDGTEVKSKTIPAYHKYQGMGSKVDNIDNENMLSQVTANYSYIKDPISGLWKETGVGVSTWSNSWSYRLNNGTESLETDPDAKVWRKHKQYVWKGELNDDGTYMDFADNFNWNSSTQSPEWKEVSEVTKYSRYSSPLEFKDINNNRASTKMGDGSSKVIASANAAYVDMYYSGAEYLSTDSNSYFDGEVKSLGLNESRSHTGDYCIYIGSGQKGFEVKLPENINRVGAKSKFKVSVWVNSGEEDKARIMVGTNILTFNNNEIIKAGSWTQLNGYVTISTSEIIVAITSTGSPIYMDDFRLHPVASSMTSYVYNEWDELSYILNSNNLGTHFKYDGAGRLKETHTEVKDFDGPGSGGFKKVSENKYQYKNPE